MPSEIRNCQNCKSQFTVEPDDFDFYEKIKVPSPTWCPECRMKRRMCFRNERGLFKSDCGFCGEGAISMHDPADGATVYCSSCWWSDGWDPLIYGRGYDFTSPFWSQMRELMRVVPRVALETLQNQGSPFSNYTWCSKNVYLSPSTLYSENVMYSHATWYSTDVVDSAGAYHSQLVYEMVESHKCSGVIFVQNSRECTDSSFLFDCRNCTNCFMSRNLRNRSFVFRDRQLTPEEYRSKMEKIDRGSRRVLAELVKEYEAMKKAALHRFANTNKVQNVTGDIVVNSKNCFYCFRASDCENVRYGTQMTEIKDSADLFGAGDKAELLYEGVDVGLKDSLVLFSKDSFDGIHDIRCCDYCRSGCSHLFGCVGLRKKQYCILNKQYSKEEYEALVPRIILQMSELPYSDAKGRVYRYGEFFPPELSPFAYNQTSAQEYFPLTKEEVVQHGYTWRDPEQKDHRATRQPQDVPDHIKEVGDDITHEIIACAHRGPQADGCTHQCTGAFRIIPEELAFYRRFNLPLPVACPNCRHYGRLAQRNPLRLWKRRCMKMGCENEFETSYSPERTETVYCEVCYQHEVA